MRHVISILLENESGALSRVVGLFSQRGYNIEDITAAPTEDKSISRITILTTGDKVVVEHITKQLHKLINVIKVTCLDESQGALEQEILFVKVQAPNRNVREDVRFLAETFKAVIADVTPESLILQLVGTPAEVDRFLNTVKEQTAVIEVVRSGICGICRGSRSLKIK